MPTSRVEPRWLTAEDVIDINKDEVAETGEPFTLMDEGKLLGALSRPSMRWAYDNEDDIVVLASSLLFAIAESHAFAQGNKRTGFTAASVFLELNGYSLAPLDDEDQERLGAIIVEVIEHKFEFEDFVLILAPCVAPNGADGSQTSADVKTIVYPAATNVERHPITNDVRISFTAEDGSISRVVLDQVRHLTLIAQLHKKLGGATLTPASIDRLKPGNSLELRGTSFAKNADGSIQVELYAQSKDGLVTIPFQLSAEDAKGLHTLIGRD